MTTASSESENFKFGFALFSGIGGCDSSCVNISRGLRAVYGNVNNIDAFTDVEQFKATMDDMLHALRTATPIPGQERVLYPGLSEHEEVLSRRATGIPLHKEVIQWFGEITRELGVAPLDERRGAGARGGPR